MAPQLTITWRENVPESTRAELTRALMRPTVRARKRAVSYAAARARMERNGLAALRDSEVVPYSPRVVRIYYRSMGGEILCFESTHTAAQAARLHYAHKAIPAWREGYMASSDAVDAECWSLREASPPLLYGARLVVLPSQLDQELELARLDQFRAAA